MKKSKKLFAAIIAFVFMAVAFFGNAIQAFAEDPATPAAEVEPTFLEQYGIFIFLGVAVVAFFVFNIFRRKKQVKEGQSMMETIKPGVFIMTQGGVIGKITEVIVISPTEKHIVLETGGQHKSYVTYDIRAVGMILKPEQLIPQAAQPAEEIKMPTDEEVQALIDNAHSPVKPGAEVFPGYSESGADGISSEGNVSPEGKPVKKTAKNRNSVDSDSGKSEK